MRPADTPFIVIAGMPARDTKLFPDGARVESLGGILFTATAAAVLSRDSGVDILPVMRAGRDVAPRALPLLANTGCRLDAVHVVDDTTQHSIITFADADTRSERVDGGLPELTPADLKPWLDADVIAVNFITGREMSLSTFQWLRQHYPRPIIMDFHTLALETLPDGTRRHRRRQDWSEWIACADVVQMNRDEAETLAGACLSERRDCVEFARGLLPLGPTAVVVTLADSGAVAVEQTRHGHTVHDLPAHSPDHVIDTVGCGDVFLAGLSVGWQRWRQCGCALELASHAAGVSCGYEGLRGVEHLAAIEP